MPAAQRVGVHFDAGGHGTGDDVEGELVLLGGEHGARRHPQQHLVRIGVATTAVGEHDQCRDPVVGRRPGARGPHRGDDAGEPLDRQRVPAEPRRPAVRQVRRDPRQPGDGDDEERSRRRRQRHRARQPVGGEHLQQGRGLVVGGLIAGGQDGDRRRVQVQRREVLQGERPGGRGEPRARGDRRDPRRGEFSGCGAGLGHRLPHRPLGVAVDEHRPRRTGTGAPRGRGRVQPLGEHGTRVGPEDAVAPAQHSGRHRGRGGVPDHTARGGRRRVAPASAGERSEASPPAWGHARDPSARAVVEQHLPGHGRHRSHGAGRAGVRPGRHGVARGDPGPALQAAAFAVVGHEDRLVGGRRQVRVPGPPPRDPPRHDETVLDGLQELQVPGPAVVAEQLAHLGSRLTRGVETPGEQVGPPSAASPAGIAVTGGPATPDPLQVLAAVQRQGSGPVVADDHVGR